MQAYRCYWVPLVIFFGANGKNNSGIFGIFKEPPVKTLLIKAGTAISDIPNVKIIKDNFLDDFLDRVKDIVFG